jgi:hypothetical protein
MGWKEIPDPTPWVRRRGGDRAATGEAPAASDAALRVCIARTFCAIVRSYRSSWAVRWQL